MKKILLLISLTSCASFKATTQSSHSSKQQEVVEYGATKSQEKRTGFNLLEQYTKGDSTSYEAIIRANDATIWLSGTRRRYAAGKKQVDSSRLDSQGSRVGARHATEQQQTQGRVQSRKWSVSVYWLLVPACLLLLAWFFWKRLF